MTMPQSGKVKRKKLESLNSGTQSQPLWLEFPWSNITPVNLNENRKFATTKEKARYGINSTGRHVPNGAFTGWQQCTSAEPLLKQEHCQNATPPAISTGEKQAFAMQWSPQTSAQSEGPAWWCMCVTADECSHTQCCDVHGRRSSSRSLLPKPYEFPTQPPEGRFAAVLYYGKKGAILENYY